MRTEKTAVRRLGVIIAALLVVMLSLTAATAAVGAVTGSARQSAAESDPEAIREDTRQVMERSEFSYEKSWSERFTEWLAEQIDKLFPDSEVTPGGTFAGGIGSLVAYLIIMLAVLAVIAAVVYVIVKRVRVPKKPDDEPPTETTIEHRRSADAWESDATAHEAAGEWKQAIRARYRMMVRTLTDRRQLPDVAGRTTGELRGDLATTTPDAADAFDTASLLFELPWYADAATGPDENARFRAAAEVVLSAPVEDRYDGLSVGSVQSARDVIRVST